MKNNKIALPEVNYNRMLQALPKKAHEEFRKQYRVKGSKTGHADNMPKKDKVTYEKAVKLLNSIPAFISGGKFVSPAVYCNSSTPKAKIANKKR